MYHANDLLEAAKCIICLETYTEFTHAPILTACGHAFCRECVEKATVNHVFQCFECRKITLCDTGLKVNINMLQCLQAMNLLAPEDPVAYAAALERSVIVADKNQKLVDNITMALTEYVFQNEKVDQNIAVEDDEDGDIYLVEYHSDGTPYYTMVR
uniref:RING-type domain-containing protein n=1 Tax=Panagrellus redivivus TaxID=6233 RepID=A0A7E4ZQA3_PANRE